MNVRYDEFQRKLAFQEDQQALLKKHRLEQMRLEKQRRQDKEVQQKQKLNEYEQMKMKELEDIVSTRMNKDKRKQELCMKRAMDKEAKTKANADKFLERSNKVQKIAQMNFAQRAEKIQKKMSKAEEQLAQQAQMKEAVIKQEQAK